MILKKYTRRVIGAIMALGFVLGISGFSQSAVFAQSQYGVAFFADVPANVYFYGGVKSAVSRGIIDEGENFYPDRPLTRAEFAVMAVRTLALPSRIPENPSFADVPVTFWGYGEIETAKFFGLAQGTGNGLFEPLKKVNRAEAAVMIMNAFLDVEMSVSAPEDLVKTPWAASSVKKALRAGFFSGYPDGMFGPEKNIVRAEGVTVFARVLEKLDSGKIKFSLGVSLPKVLPALWESSAKARMKAVFPKYKRYNFQMRGENGLFFAFDPRDAGVRFAWYGIDAQDPLARPARAISSSEFSLIFNAAFSTDGKEMIVTAKTGEVFAQNPATGEKRELGVFTTEGGYASYSHPVYTPDGTRIIFLNAWENKLVIIGAGDNNFDDAVEVEGFWLPGIGGDTPEDGGEISVYEFSDDGKSMTFINGSVLNLETFIKE